MHNFCPALLEFVDLRPLSFVTSKLETLTSNMPVLHRIPHSIRPILQIDHPTGNYRGSTHE